MNRTHALRTEIVARRRNYLKKQLADRGPDHASAAWLIKEIDALDWVLRLIENLDEEDVLEEWSS